MNVQDCVEVLFAFAKYIPLHKSLLITTNLICLRLVELAPKLDSKAKDMIKHSLAIAKINNKILQALINKWNQVQETEKVQQTPALNLLIPFEFSSLSHSI